MDVEVGQAEINNKRQKSEPNATDSTQVQAGVEGPQEEPTQRTGVKRVRGTG